MQRCFTRRGVLIPRVRTIESVERLLLGEWRACRRLRPTCSSFQSEGSGGAGFACMHLSTNYGGGQLREFACVGTALAVAARAPSHTWEDYTYSADACTHTCEVRTHAFACVLQAVRLTEQLGKAIPAQQFEVAVQGTVNGRITARATVKALRKDVTAKCYGGDVTRKLKLLNKQKAGKKKMKAIGNVHIPSKAFLGLLKLKD